MKWTRYELYKAVEKKNALLQIVYVWEHVQTIEVLVSMNKYEQVTGDLVYRVFAPMGVTKFKEFNYTDSYKLVNSEHEYYITSLNQEGRYAQLNLKEVASTIQFKDDEMETMTDEELQAILDTIK